jgi:hypothetical protein
MSDRKYTQEDLAEMGLRLAAIRNFAELLNGNYERKSDGPLLASIALILETLVEPVEGFLSWVDTYAEFPDEDEPVENT